MSEERGVWVRGCRACPVSCLDESVNGLFCVVLFVFLCILLSYCVVKVVGGTIEKLEPYVFLLLL